MTAFLLFNLARKVDLQRVNEYGSILFNFHLFSIVSDAAARLERFLDTNLRYGFIFCQSLTF